MSSTAERKEFLFNLKAVYRPGAKFGFIFFWDVGIDFFFVALVAKDFV